MEPYIKSEEDSIENKQKKRAMYFEQEIYDEQQH